MYKSCEVYLCFGRREVLITCSGECGTTPLLSLATPPPSLTLSPSHYSHSPPFPLGTGSDSSEVGQWCVGGGEEEDE